MKPVSVAIWQNICYDAKRIGIVNFIYSCENIRKIYR